MLTAKQITPVILITGVTAFSLPGIKTSYWLTVFVPMVIAGQKMFLDFMQKCATLLLCKIHFPRLQTIY